MHNNRKIRQNFINIYFTYIKIYKYCTFLYNVLIFYYIIVCLLFVKIQFLFLSNNLYDRKTLCLYYDNRNNSFYRYILENKYQIG